MTFAVPVAELVVMLTNGYKKKRDGANRLFLYTTSHLIEATI